ncbi:hypothetical protein [Chitinophaga skermanii]|uniref:hypothetical protein n=1 Tax=Chitinophaga skermanii TaxID=331697 RepID=UPI0011E5C6A4|nr:hypothetical protein [Chitinophaga skermanii]
MKKFLYQKIWSLFLLAVFAFHATPREFVHLFADHCDTKHEKIEGTIIDLPHKHCDFLQIGYSPVDVYQVTYLPIVAVTDWYYAVPTYPHQVPAVTWNLPLRAPPATVA